MFSAKLENCFLDLIYDKFSMDLERGPGHADHDTADHDTADHGYVVDARCSIKFLNNLCTRRRAA
jgi:hypothetical protein